MNLSKIFPCLVMALALGGCAVESSDAGTEESVGETSDELGARRYHYPPSVQDVTWHAGCGIVREGAPPCEFGLTMTYVKNWIDVTFTHSEHVNNSTKVLTITVDTWSTSQIHSRAAVHPETIKLSPANLQLSTNYKVVVVDRHHNTLWTGNIATYLAM